VVAVNDLAVVVNLDRHEDAVDRNISLQRGELVLAEGREELVGLLVAGSRSVGRRSL
jgi:hypothetical protein